MADLIDSFSRKQWKGCCTKGCKKCELAQAYIDAYGRHDGLQHLKADRKIALGKKRRSVDAAATGKKGGKKHKKRGRKK
ncbi:MAG: hypothetical protein R2826_04875 [Thermoleophilia bacterium]